MPTEKPAAAHAPANDPLARHVKCPMCGQMVDRQHLGQVYHHDDQPHEPLPPETR